MTGIRTALLFLALSAFGSPAGAQHHSSGLPHNIPDFCGAPTVESVGNGPWSSAATWSTRRIPTDADRVAIAAGTNVTYDVSSTRTIACVAVRGRLAFRTDANTLLQVGTVLVHEEGTLEIGTPAAPVREGVTAQIVFADSAPDRSTDPEQFGTGLIGIGTVTMHGAIKTPTFVRLASEPQAGQSALSVSDPVSGWQPGDRLIVPDTRHLRNNEIGASFQPQWEELTLASAQGTSLALTSALRFNHIGARDADGHLDFLPHVGNLSRNVVLRSQNPAGARGHTIYTSHATVDIRYVLFKDLGRTTTAPLDNTTFTPAGDVGHVGTNQIGRYAVHFHHLFGPVNRGSKDPQYTFVGNAVDGAFKWGVAIHNTHYGQVSRNVVYNTRGAGVMTEDGSESYNVIEDNFVMRVEGVGGRGDDRANKEFGFEGDGFWFRGPMNYVRRNVAADLTQTSSAGRAGPYTGYKYFLTYLGNIKIPLYPGADTSAQGQYRVVDSHEQAVLEFKDNEAYAVNTGIAYWWLGSVNSTVRPNVKPSRFEGLRIWHAYGMGINHYPSHRIVFDGLVIRGADPAGSACCSIGFAGNDYMASELSIVNADIQGMRVGLRLSTDSAGTMQLVKDSTLRNVSNVSMVTLWTSAYRSDKLPPRKLVFNNVKTGSWNGAAQGVTPGNYVMEFSANGVRNLIQDDRVLVYNHDGIKGRDFRIYYSQEAPDFVVPASILNKDGSPSLQGAPVAGLTNRQSSLQFGVAIAGAVAPCTTRMAGVEGFVCDVGEPYSESTVLPPSAPQSLRVLP